MTVGTPDRPPGDAIPSRAVRRRSPYADEICDLIGWEPGMNQSELIEKVAQATELNQAAAGQAVKAVVNAILARA
jgi:hypothetical protein